MASFSLNFEVHSDIGDLEVASKQISNFPEVFEESAWYFSTSNDHEFSEKNL
jgi:hypothetical protein